MTSKRLLQTGQSTIELIVSCLMLVPLFLTLHLLGKYLDLSQTTTVASRYVAFEGAVHHSSSNTGWKTDAELATEVRRRFYSRNDLTVKTNDVVSDVEAERNPLWVDHKGTPLLQGFNRINVNTTKASMDTLFNGVTNVLDHSAHFELPDGNLYAGTVNVQLANIAELIPFDALNLSITRKTVVLVDPWSAKGPNDVSDKVKHSELVFPTTPLLVPATALSPLIMIVEPNASPPSVGQVKPDWVPADRLRPY